MPTRKAKAPQAGKKSTVADKLWLWGHDAGAHNDSWGLPRPSRITPIEAAFYLGIPNLIMVRYLGRPPLPFDQYALPLRPLKRVVWSVVGAGGQTDDTERRHVLDLAARHANITGVMLDDFFGADASSPLPGEGTGGGPALSTDQLRNLRGQLSVGGRRLRIWAVLYEHQLDKPLAEYLKFLDVVNFWTWNSENIPDLDGNLDRLDAIAGKCSKVLGCYLWDYGKKKPMPLNLLGHQCELGLHWLRKGRIEGMVFLASCICDLELEAVEWLRDWIARTGSKRI